MKVQCTAEDIWKFTLAEVKKHDKEIERSPEYYGMRKRFAKLLIDKKDDKGKDLAPATIAEITSLKLQSLPVKRGVTGVSK